MLAVRCGLLAKWLRVRVRVRVRAWARECTTPVDVRFVSSGLYNSDFGRSTILKEKACSP